MQRSKKMTSLLSASFLESVSQLCEVLYLLFWLSLRDLGMKTALSQAF